MFRLILLLEIVMVWTLLKPLSLETHSLKNLQIDIALLSETNFTKDSRWLFEGYKTYNSRHPSNNARGGASIFIRNNIKHSLIDVIENEKFLVAIIEIESTLRAFNIGVTYSPPRQLITRVEYQCLLAKLGHRFLIGGDWNSKNVRWASR